MSDFHSIYAPVLSDYIEFKRSLGYELRCLGNYKTFDRFAYENHFSTIGLTHKQCEQWCIKRLNEKDVTRYKRVNDVRNFCIYLNACGYSTCIPSNDFSYHRDFVPHIFTHDELNNFFLVCDNLVLTGYSNTTCIYPALFRLLLGCGLRISEALRLKIQDIDFKAKTLILHETKNGEERLIPFSESLKEILLSYKSRYRLNSHESEIFFAKKDGTRVSSDTVYRWFRKILFEADIPHGGKSSGPRVHDFRHTFSVLSLAAMDDRGLNLYYALPILSKYLGHKSLEATEKYVRLTAEMYPSIMDKVDKLSAYVIPEVNYHENH